MTGRGGRRDRGPPFQVTLCPERSAARTVPFASSPWQPAGGVLLGLSSTERCFELSRYSPSILAALARCSGPQGRARRGYDHRIFITGFLTNAIVAVILTLRRPAHPRPVPVALITFGLRIFNNVASSGGTTSG